MPRCRGIVGAPAGIQRCEYSGCAAENCVAFPWNDGLGLKDLFICNKAITNTWFSENILRAFRVDLRVSCATAAYRRANIQCDQHPRVPIHA